MRRQDRSSRAPSARELLIALAAATPRAFPGAGARRGARAMHGAVSPRRDEPTPWRAFAGARARGCGRSVTAGRPHTAERPHTAGRPQRSPRRPPPPMGPRSDPALGPRDRRRLRILLDTGPESAHPWRGIHAAGRGRAPTPGPGSPTDRVLAGDLSETDEIDTQRLTRLLQGAKSLLPSRDTSTFGAK